MCGQERIVASGIMAAIAVSFISDHGVSRLNFAAHVIGSANTTLQRNHAQSTFYDHSGAGAAAGDEIW